jgi:hypothetical protein
MPKRRSALTAAWALLLVCAWPVATLADAAAPAQLPPALQALEQKTLALQLTSERFSVSEIVSGSGTPAGLFGGFDSSAARAAASVPLLTASGEVGFAPLQASFHESLFGIAIEGRLIGTTLYVREPFIASLDGGRPWVDERGKSLQETAGAGVGTLGGAAPGSGAQAFGKLLGELNGASGLRELGPLTVAGQAAMGFGGTIEVRKLGGYGVSTPALGQLVEPTAAIDVFIAEDGLPVRTSATLTIRPRDGAHAQLIAQSDVLAVNLPVSAVERPPADETISAARLKRLQARFRSSRQRTVGAATK